MINKRRTHPQQEDHLFSHSPNQRELGSTKPCAHVEENTNPPRPASGRGRSVLCNPAVSKVNLRDPAAQTPCSFHTPSPWSSRIEEGNVTRRATTHHELHRIPETQADNELRKILWAEQGLVYRYGQRMCDPGPAYWFQVHPRWHILLTTPGVIRRVRPCPTNQ